MSRAPSKWAIGEPMIEWCDRNGLDARLIPDRPDAIVIRDDLRSRFVSLMADVIYIFSPSEDRPQGFPDAIAEFHDSDGWLTITRSVPVDSEPPLNPEWVALFGRGANA